MNTQQTPPNPVRQSRRTLDSFLRTLTVAAALLVFGVSAPMAVADHMGNHERGSAESASCGQTATETPEVTSVDPLRASIHRHGPRNE